MSEMNFAERALIGVGKFTLGIVATATVGTTLGASCVFGVYAATNALKGIEEEPKTSETETETRTYATFCVPGLEPIERESDPAPRSVRFRDRVKYRTENESRALADDRDVGGSR